MNRALVAFALIVVVIAAGLLYKRAPQTIQFYTWDTYDAPELFREFEKQTGIHVNTTLFYSNDDLEAKLRAGGKYDLITPSGNYIPRLVEAKLLQPLPEEIRAYGQKLAKPVQNPTYDSKYTWSIPLFYGTTGIAVNTGLTSEKITSWSQIFKRPEGEKETVGMLGEESSTLLAITSIAAGSRNCDASSDVLRRLELMLAAQKPFVKTYKAEGYYEHLAADDITFQMAWSGDAYIAREKNPKIQYVYPSEGVELWLDTFAIPRDSRNIRPVIKFIQFLLEPSNMARYAVFSGNIPSILDARDKLPEQLRDAPEFNIPAGVKTFVSDPCPPEVIAAYNKIAEAVAVK
ncbi:MAG TPA: spermidine/putrescine ABC transporter substrate-binding protein [Patescibacteria group bacterium]|nr:spermidine/putrescine ABC transporter substrate-binding protein [Patescibacteria group bacterium]